MVMVFGPSDEALAESVDDFRQVGVKACVWERLKFLVKSATAGERRS